MRCHKLQPPALAPGLAGFLWREQHPEVPLQLRFAIETADDDRGKRLRLEHGMVLAPEAPPWKRCGSWWSTP
jgi:hypothetical protein